MQLNQRIAYVVERDDLDSRHDIGPKEYPALWWAMYNRRLDYIHVDPVPIMPGSWDGYQRLLADDYWPPGPDAPEWARVEEDYPEDADVEAQSFLSQEIQDMVIEKMDRQGVDIATASVTA